MEKKSPNTLHKTIGIFSLALSLSLSLELSNVVQKRQSEESEAPADWTEKRVSRDKESHESLKLGNKGELRWRSDTGLEKRQPHA